MKDLSPLLQMSDTMLMTKFLHECVDDMIGKKKMNYDSYVGRGDLKWTIEDYEATKKCVQHLYLKNIESDSGLPADLHKSLQNCFQIRRNDIYQTLAKDAVLKNGNMLVENFDWKLKWILGSSDLSTIREPLLQIKLNCVKMADNDEIKKHVVSVEVNLNQVDSLIDKLLEMKNKLNVNSGDSN